MNEEFRSSGVKKVPSDFRAKDEHHDHDHGPHSTLVSRAQGPIRVSTFDSAAPNAGQPCPKVSAVASQVVPKSWAACLRFVAAYAKLPEVRGLFGGAVRGGASPLL